MPKLLETTRISTAQKRFYVDGKRVSNHEFSLVWLRMGIQNRREEKQLGGGFVRIWTYGKDEGLQLRSPAPRGRIGL